MVPNYWSGRMPSLVKTDITTRFSTQNYPRYCKISFIGRPDREIWAFKFTNGHPYHIRIWIRICEFFVFSILLINGSFLVDGSKKAWPVFDGEKDWLCPVITKCNVELKFLKNWNLEKIKIILLFILDRKFFCLWVEKRLTLFWWGIRQ